MAEEDLVVGRGGGALLPKVADDEEAFAAFCWFKALILSLRDTN